MRLLALGRVELAVAGDHRPVGEAHDEGRVVAAAVGVDQQARVAGHDGGRAELGRQRPHDRRNADVVGDVPLQLRWRQPQGAVVRRQQVAGVIAEDDEAAVGAPREDAVALLLAPRD